MKRLAIAALAIFCASAANWTDRKEYDLVLSIRAESSPQKRVALLDEWKTKYPKSEYQEIRRELYFAAYQAMDDSANMCAMAGEMLAAQPDNKMGAYWFALLLPEQKKPSQDQLALGEKSAALLIGEKSQAGAEWTAHRVLGWVHWRRGENALAEEEFRKCLELNPNAVQISAWLGTLMGLEQKPEMRVPALWQLARAAGYHGNGALPDVQQRQIANVLERLYISYHGDTSGLDQLRNSAAAKLYPPAGFDIENAATAALRKQDEELSRSNPQLAAWIRIRQKLESPEGDKYFADNLQGKPLTRLKGTLIKSEPPGRPNELTLGIVDPAQPEIVLKLDSPFPSAAEPGTVLEFEGVGSAVAKGPFILTLTTERAKISGWPASPARRPGK
jgi:hypothetical protein